MNPPLTVESLREALETLSAMGVGPMTLQQNLMIVPPPHLWRIIHKREKTFARRLRRCRHRDRGRPIMNIMGFMVPREWL